MSATQSAPAAGGQPAGGAFYSADKQKNRASKVNKLIFVLIAWKISKNSTVSKGLNQGFSNPLPAGKKMPAEPPKNALQALKENVLL